VNHRFPAPYVRPAAACAGVFLLPALLLAEDQLGCRAIVIGSAVIQTCALPLCVLS
jgi:hypothetical protein